MEPDEIAGSLNGPLFTPPSSPFNAVVLCQTTEGTDISQTLNGEDFQDGVENLFRKSYRHFFPQDCSVTYRQPNKIIG